MRLHDSASLEKKSFVATERDTPENLKRREEFRALVAILDAGAYGYTMASRCNGRALPAEVFVRGGKIVAKTERAPRSAWVKERADIGK